MFLGKKRIYFQSNKRCCNSLLDDKERTHYLFQSMNSAQAVRDADPPSGSEGGDRDVAPLKKGVDQILEVLGLHFHAPEQDLMRENVPRRFLKLFNGLEADRKSVV